MRCGWNHGARALHTQRAAAPPRPTCAFYLLPLLLPPPSPSLPARPTPPTPSTLTSPTPLANEVHWLEDVKLPDEIV